MNSLKDALTKEEAVRYIGTLTLESTEEIIATFENQRLQLLNRIIRAYQHHLSFQNLTLLSRNDDELRVPTPSDILESGLSLQGGLCFNLNVFMHYLLQGIGYDSYLIAGSYSSSSSGNSHVAVVVKGLDSSNDESLHLVDVGCGHPTLEAVPLHQLPQSYFQAGLEYQIQLIDGQYVRLHRKGDSYGAAEKPIMIGEWRKVFHFDPTPRSFEYFSDFMKTVFVEKENNNFYRAIRIVRFPMTGDYTLLAIRGDQLFTCDCDGEKQSQSIVGDTFQLIKKHFPHVPGDHVVRAIAAFNADSARV